ncbi:hypothetical protein SCLCIDRAFT_29899 [Scleroderma citrinum Foug A]|uniref:Uncharacterized protein n=1 Tax=Scleroderma citrinum Foug A TaxID=1036808 RepID=A0A0C2ZUD0_9AGAM|nr:hypothetical protein SCLCIDRAFT_29899 [Scleroderma citrinum Foug A]
MSAESQLESLLEIINSSARQAIVEYKKEGINVPTINSTEFHPLDTSTHHVALRKAVRLLEGACQQLCASLAPPQCTVLNLVRRYDWVCVDIAHRKGIADILDKHPEGLHVNELSQMIGIEKTKLARILRLLTTRGLFKEVNRDGFANNRLSLVLKSTCNAGYVTRTVEGPGYPASNAFFDALDDPEYGASHDPGKTAWLYAMRQKGLSASSDAFEILEKDDEECNNFYKVMVGAGEIFGSLSALDQYPWNEVSTVCDVGANLGTFSIPLAKTHPHLKIVHQDLERVIPQAKKEWERKAPEALQEQRVDFVSLNFFEEAPVVGQDVYYLRLIIHDWADAEALTILRNVRKAMAPHSRLLIQEFIVGNPDRTSDPAAKSLGFDIAPEPMLPGFGAGNMLMYQQDMLMLMAFNGKERLLDDWIALATAVGLRLEKAYDLGDTSVLDFRVA